MEEYFTGSEYQTPENTRRFLGDRLLLGSRWYFQLRNLNIILKARSMAVEGTYDREAWVRSSYSIIKLIEGCGGRFHFEGLEHLRGLEGP
ncbi:MAG TPA: 1-acyl-sn-glycerol-3-phosphate acyltransferase, partial [Bacillota bacterium]|nr:1-acyl-sn-glycerol-3-phosphate acyltransferase [Bacillota bacterium]